MTEEETAENPYAMALRLIGSGGDLRPAEAERACAALILAYAKGPEHVDWGDVQTALEGAMAAFGLSVHEDGASLVLAPPAPRRKKPGAPPADVQQTSLVFNRGGEWWFYDEAGFENGPFADAVDAHLQMALYIEFLEHGPEKIWQRMGRRMGNFIANRFRS